MGDDVAIVAAVNEEWAEKALKLIKVEYEVFEPVLDFEKAEGHESVIHPEEDLVSLVDVGLEADRNIAAKVDISKGDVDKVLSECDVVRCSYK